VEIQLSGLLSLFEAEGDCQVDLVAGDVAVLDQHVLVLDSGTLYIAQSLRSAFDGHVDRILEALV
jgi:hypothetical protein